MPPAGGPPDADNRGLIITIVLLFIVILGTGIFFYQSQEKQIKDRITSDLTAIATLKANQIAVWRADRLYDAQVISSGAFFIEGADHYLTYGDDESREKILSRFREMKTSPHYDNILLVDPQGNVRLTLDPSVTSIQPSVIEQVDASLKNGDAVLTDFPTMPGLHHIHLNVIAPLTMKTNGSEKRVGAVILSINPDDFLYPLVQSWPVPSGSAETLLVEREGDHVLYLNELRHRNNTALNLTIPLTQTDVPAVMAVLGTTGVFTGKDYRGVDVISVLGPVPGSPWFMVAKVDTTEAYSSWQSFAILIIALVTGTLLGAIIIAGLVWQRRQKYYYRTLYAAEAENTREEQRNRERLETLLQLAEMESASEQELVDFVLAAGCRLSGSPLAFIGVISPDESVFDITAWSNFAMKESPAARSLNHLPIEKAGIWAEAMRKHTTVIMNDYAAPREGETSILPGHVPITRFASVPIFGGERVVMVFTVANRETDYTDMEVDNLTLLMQGVWNHFRKRLADEALRQKTSDLEAAYEELTASDEELSANYEELARSQQALAESERKYRNLYQYAQVGLFETSFKDGTVVACNRQYAELAGFASVEDAIGKDILHLYANPDDHTEVGRILREQGYIENHTVKFRNRATGKLFWGQFSARFNYEREVAEGTIIDVTARKEAEKEIRDAKNFLDNIVEQSPNPIWISDEKGTLVRLNRACCDVLRITPEEVVGKYNVFEDSIVEAQGKMPLVRSVFEEGKSVNFDLEYDSKLLSSLALEQYAKVFLNVTIFPVRDSTGKITNAVIQHLDFTERKRAEEALRESEEKYRILFTRMIEGSALHEIISDGSGKAVDYRILDINPAFEFILGLTRDAVIGKTSREAYGVDSPPYLETYARVAATNLPEVFESYFAPLKKHISISVYSPGKGRFATIFEDITSRKEAERLREKLIRELEQKNAELERFTYTVSHDLKSPLITIRGFAGLLEEDAHKCDPVQLKRDVQRIMTAADTMQQLLSDVLELSRIGRIISPPHNTPFSTIIREAVELLAGPLAERGVAIEIDPDLPDVYVDHARIREVMVNLIENAIKYSGDRPDPHIRIAVDRSGETPVFFVQDNGIGIDPRYLERIFNLFEKLNPSCPGSGVGLTIVRRIIEVHGGKIWAESEGPGKGTTFRFTLPGGTAGGDDRS